MHTAAIVERKLPFYYTTFETPDTAAAVNAMRTLGLRGLSVTIPHKEKALELVDVASPEAKEAGAVNTIINDGRKLTGENTDWLGIVAAFSEAGVDLTGKAALVLGAGGVAKGAILALRRMGIGSVTVANRTAERAKVVAEKFQVQAVDWQKIEAGNFDVILQMTSSDEIVLPGIRTECVVFDAVTRETRLLREARANGSPVISGLRMLLHQGVRQFELFTGEKAPFEVMERALVEEFSRE